MNWALVQIALATQADQIYERIAKGELDLEIAQTMMGVAETCRALFHALGEGLEDHQHR